MSGKKRRTIHIDGKAWMYSIGRKFIQIWSPDRKKHVVKYHELLGITEKEWCDECFGVEPGEYWEHSHDHDITLGPGKIKAYIENGFSTVKEQVA